MTVSFKLIGETFRDISMATTVLSVADDSLASIGDSLKKIRLLAETSLRDDLSIVEKHYLEIEKDNLLSTISRIASNTEVNDLILLDGTFTNKLFKVGFEKDNDLHISFHQAMTAAGLGINAIGFWSKNASEEAVIDVDAAIQIVNNYRVQIEALQYSIKVAESDLEKRIFHSCVDHCVQQEFEYLFREKQFDDNSSICDA